MSDDVKAKDRNLDDTFSITMELERPLLLEEYEAHDKTNEKTKRKYLTKRTIIIAIISVFIIGIVGFFIWIKGTYEPHNFAKQALISDNNVEVKVDDFISFTPKTKKATKGFILYPGAKVDPRSYAPLAKKIANKGYEVVILDVPLNLAILSPGEANEVMQKYKNINSWVVGGHSLGGTVSAKFASQNKNVSGVVLIASYPMGDELKGLGIDVMSICGSIDGVINFKSLAQAREKLPSSTTYVEIEGGNHSQFGDYGKQKGDNDAIISQEDQLDITANSIIKFLESK